MKHLSGVVKNGLWLTVLQGCNTLLPLATVPYVTRILGIDCYGVFSLALNWITYCRVIVEYGFTMSGSRRVALAGDDSEKICSIYNGIVWARLLLLAVSFTGLLFLCIVTSRENVELLVSIAVLGIVPLGSALQQTWLFQGKQDMKLISIIGITSRICSVICIFIFVESQSDLYLYCALYGSTNLLIGVFGMIVAQANYGLRLNTPRAVEIKDELVNGWYLFTSSAMSTLFSGFGMTLLGFVSTSAEVGAYGALSKIPLVVTTLFSPVAQAIFPHVSILFQESILGALRYVKRQGAVSVSIVAIVSLSIMAFRNPIIDIAFGHEYASYSHLVAPLMIWSTFGVVNNFLGIQTLVGSGHQKEYSKAFALGFAANIVLCVLLIPLFDAFGTALATMVGEIVLTALLIMQIKRTKLEAK